MSADDLARILDELGQRLGPTGQHVFELAVRQKITESVIWLLAAAIFAVVLLIIELGTLRWCLGGYRAAQLAYQQKQSSYSYDKPDLFDYFFPWAIGSIFGGIALGAALIAVISSAIVLLNPEYAALREIVSAVAR